ncbi:uracil-DNA glycosylase family protein [Pseudooceanicola sp. MF1-13]|uniref:uracil-DNA glycosylase n=1 Tax=Pseudooceanicola sp. MF1-13 TaxID=3379095 RepID=UPI0038918EA4
MESAADWHSAVALLDWQVDLGADEAIGDTPIDRFAVAEELAANPPAKAKAQAHLQPVERKEIDAVEVARHAAGAATSLDELRQALAGFDHCALKRGAKSLVFGDGNPAARVMILGEAPSREDDRAGQPFTDRTGALLDRMLAAICLNRGSEDPETAVYITNVLPWRPPQNRDPAPEEIAMMLPFLQKHVELVAPDFLVMMGNIACLAAVKKQGIMRLRGTWDEAFGIPALPMVHPTNINQPHAKRDAWKDLLSLRVRLNAKA